MGFFRHFGHKNHCYATSFLEVFAIVLFVGSLFVWLVMQQQIAQQLALLFGLATLGGGLGLVMYHFMKK